MPRPSTANGSIDDDDSAYELRQRRRLVSDWAAMSQAERDTYQARSSTSLARRPRRGWRPPVGCFKAVEDTRVAFNVVSCTAAQPLGPRDRSGWTKLRILLYRLDGEEGPLIDDGRASVCVPNPESEAGRAACGGGLGPDQVLSWQYLENADFVGGMFMTSAGTVVFDGMDGPRVLVDREALDTGRVLLCDFENNGRARTSCRLRPCILYEFWPLIESLGKPVRGVMEREIWKSPTYNGPSVFPLLRDVPAACWR